MPSLDELTAWMNGYSRAWMSNDSAEIPALFTEDAATSQRPSSNRG